jgi:N-acetylmuramic acid 6-phosphate etherase
MKTKATTYLGIDGGGTRCRARIEDENGRVLGEASAGPATTRMGLEKAWRSILQATEAAAAQGGLTREDFARMHAGIAVAGFYRRGAEAALKASTHPFASISFISDGLAACLGAHSGANGAIVVAGTGSVGVGLLEGREIRLAGYGFPVSDEGSGADIGLQVVRLALRAADRRHDLTPLLSEVLAAFDDDPHQAVAWSEEASAADYAAFAPIVVRHANEGDAIGRRIVERAADAIGELLELFLAKGIDRLSLVGGLADALTPWLTPELRARLRRPDADAAAGALLVARGRFNVPKTNTPDEKLSKSRVYGTEGVDPQFADLDAWSLTSAMKAMWDGQLAAVAAIGDALPAITAATEAAKAALGDRGRLVYVGAGTSGRVAVQDGAELLPTFAWPTERVRFVVAGGDSAFIASIEGAEDDVGDAIMQINATRLTPQDVVIAVAASGTTPFTVAALQQAGALGAVTIGIANNRGTPLLASAKFPILVETGRELIAGSTRMKAGTAQKIVLNLISSGIMLRLGRVYRGLMVNMAPTNAKLKRRAEAMVAQIAQCDPTQAVGSLAQAEGDIKTAVLLARGLDRAEAEIILKKCGGNLRRVFAELESAPDRHPRAATVGKQGGAA